MFTNRHLSRAPLSSTHPVFLGAQAAGQRWAGMLDTAGGLRIRPSRGVTERPGSQRTSHRNAWVAPQSLPLHRDRKGERATGPQLVPTIFFYFLCHHCQVEKEPRTVLHLNTDGQSGFV
jgi:hypothetical protein